MSAKASPSKKIFFPNLNGIRFIAALMVIIQHLEEFKRFFHLPSSYRYQTDLGGLGVTLFFVLSGFLITYLLLSEKYDFGTISLRDFYTRRVLRIWPLYYLIIVIGFLVVPKFLPFLQLAQNPPGSLNSQLLLDIFFLPNFSLLLFPSIMYVSQVWSIGVEEQFYLMWPVLIKYSGNVLTILVSIVLLFPALTLVLSKVVYDLSLTPGSSRNAYFLLSFLKNFLFITRIDCMAVGGIGAWILFNKKQRVLNFMYSRPVQVLAYILVLVFVVNEVDFYFLNYLPYSILFAIIVLNLASNTKSVLHVNSRPFDYLGKISYGIYMFHELAIVISMLALTRLLGLHLAPVYMNLAVYGMSIGLVILMSTLSYEFFEKSFLTKKIKFSMIISGDNAHVTSKTSVNELAVKE
jgi:peptidoglycan/LPS O-acetylase OafA/YrhL